MEDTTENPLSFWPQMDNARKTILASGKKVAVARFEKSMTQEDFQKASGASIDTITHFEPSEATPILLRTAKRMAKGLGISIEQFRERFEVKEPAAIRAAAHRKLKAAGPKIKK